MTTEKEIRESIGKDIHNREYIIKFNLAIQELDKDPMAMITFFDSIIPLLKKIAENNNFDWDTMIDKFKEYAKGTGQV